MKFIVSLQSVGDVITNSSSEVFVIAGDAHDKKQIINVCKSFIEQEGSSGIGGECTVKLLERKELLAHPYRHGITVEKYKGLPGPFIVIDIDWNREMSIEWIKGHFDIIETIV
jgi:hypothetical protein